VRRKHPYICSKTKKEFFDWVSDSEHGEIQEVCPFCGKEASEAYYEGTHSPKEPSLTRFLDWVGSWYSDKVSLGVLLGTLALSIFFFVHFAK
jgi:hypothetical protein